MLVVEAKGDPNVVGAKAMALLFKTYYALKGNKRTSSALLPRARWPVSLESPRSDWVGIYGLPVSDQVGPLPEVNTEPGFKMELTTWQYGTVAEILHVGPYNRETLTIDLLKKFIHDRRLEIVGEHEEEYLRGPGMFFRSDPEKYYTIIRYRVRPMSGA